MEFSSVYVVSRFRLKIPNQTLAAVEANPIRPYSGWSITNMKTAKMNITRLVK